ncbi:MAG: type II CAAX endopeptidase family protein, partial [Chloroflexota bacterium]|nr:type II CAAX endopeptidase family protein [Chloroflexota bacterium]
LMVRVLLAKDLHESLLWVLLLMWQLMTVVVVLSVVQRRGKFSLLLRLNKFPDLHLIFLTLGAAYLALFIYGALILFLETIFGVDLSFLKETNSIPSAGVDGRPVFAWVLIGLAAIIGAPISEEFLYRGVIFQSVSPRVTPWWGAVISAGLFAVAHLSVGALIPIFCIGLIFSRALYKSENLWVPIGAHMGFNSVGYVVTLFFEL